MEGSYELWSVCPSVLPSGSFLGIGSLFFSETQHVLRAHVLLCMTEPDYLKKIFMPKKWGKYAKNGQKIGFSNLLENLVINFFWIWSIMKVYTVCCILAQIPYLGKIWFLRYGPKCSWPIRLQDFKINYISKKPHFVHIDTDSWKIEVDWKILGWAWSKMGVATLFSGL